LPLMILRRLSHPQCNCVGYAPIWANDSWGGWPERRTKSDTNSYHKSHRVGMGCELNYPHWWLPVHMTSRLMSFFDITYQSKMDYQEQFHTEPKDPPHYLSLAGLVCPLHSYLLMLTTIACSVADESHWCMAKLVIIPNYNKICWTSSPVAFLP